MMMITKVYTIMMMMIIVINEEDGLIIDYNDDDMEMTTWNNWWWSWRWCRCSDSYIMYRQCSLLSAITTREPRPVSQCSEVLTYCIVGASWHNNDATGKIIILPIRGYILLIEHTVLYKQVSNETGGGTKNQQRWDRLLDNSVTVGRRLSLSGS